MKKSNMILIAIFIVLGLALLLVPPLNSKVLATDSVKLVVDGKEVTLEPRPFIEDDRTFVPVRFVLEELGGEVTWNEKERTATIVKGDISVLLRIDKHLVSFVNNKGKNHILSDVAPKIIDERTFVPARLISNIFGYEVNWDNDNRSALIDSNKKVDIEPFFNVNILKIDNEHVITGKQDLMIEIPKDEFKNGTELKYLLLDPDKGDGIVIARGKELEDKYTWLPRLEDQGNKVLVAAIYDSKGRFIGGEAKSVTIKINPKVALAGIEEGQVFHGKLTLNGDFNFAPYYVKYEIKNLDNGKFLIDGKLTEKEDKEFQKADPYGPLNWTPAFEESGNYSFKIIAFDRNHNPYESNVINGRIDVDRKTSLYGVRENQTINGPVTLSASPNYYVTETEYILRDPNTLKEESLAKMAYGSYKWFPGAEYSGKKEVFVRIKDTRGRTHESESITINLPGKQHLLLEGIGPKQVVTGEVKVKTLSNNSWENINYILINEKTGAKRTLATNVDPTTEFVFNPTRDDIGYWRIYAEAIGSSGTKLKTEEIPFRIYLDKIYTKQPIIEKDKFKDLASGMARNSWEKTGMSAALQTAQAILETGWGQSVGVDKYTGTLSKNLFGIKGEGPAGSVTITTWEEYNGVSFIIDDNFRAYNTIDESWDDHKSLLLNNDRYQPFTEVMHDSTQGAWAIRRAGYATDSQYPIKLMNIIRSNNLEELDKIDI